MKSLFDTNHRYTNDGTDLSEEVSEPIFTVMKKYIAMGYSPREISHIMIQDVIDAELTYVIGVGVRGPKDIIGGPDATPR